MSNSSKLNTRLPNLSSSQKAKLYHNWQIPSTRRYPSRSNLPHYNRCYKPPTPRSSRRVTSLVQNVGSYTQGYKSGVREMSREVAMMQDRLASFKEILESLQSDEEKVDQKGDVDKMDWEFDDTVNDTEMWDAEGQQ